MLWLLCIGSVDLVYLVYLVCLVGLVCLVNEGEERAKNENIFSRNQEPAIALALCHTLSNP